ncbi:rhomboid family intramembrane serine protease [Elizabethkingia argentiflava]|uniref:Rhomboid family intramembrane serine protease n=1 Tax=Elizabethkingia argenteiflava TaxID=2681556 RepID=A0A845PSK2_9FLAO|nr:rhomboid family intramembrane serine protease [Elizabethkingia argenteiflava]NAW50635.1 rhomboid family intramembrane serine protease [Elizabethkingia argenteiflava]
MQRYIPPITRTLLIVNVLLFAATYILEFTGVKLEMVLGAFFPGSPNFQFYQIISHMFMHGGFAHILFNMIALWSFGSAIEVTLGPQKYAILYFVCGIGAYILFNIVNYIDIDRLIGNLRLEGADIEQIYHLSKVNINGMFSNINELRGETSLKGDVQDIKQLFSFLSTPMVGASGAIYGLLVAFAMLYPDAKIMLLIPPIPIKAKYLMPVLILVELYLGTNNFKGDNVAHFAHLGGALIAFILVKIWTKNRFRIDHL